MLSDGQHTISYAAGQVDLPLAFDYLTVTAGSSTPLQDRTIIVDDTDPLLKYDGKWATQNPSSILDDFSTASFRNTTHWSTTVGDNVQFQFTGEFELHTVLRRYLIWFQEPRWPFLAHLPTFPIFWLAIPPFLRHIRSTASNLSCPSPMALSKVCP